MRKVMLDRDDLDFLEVEAELGQAPFDPLLVAIVAAIAGENRVQRAVRGVPVAFCVVPACFLAKADWCEWNGYSIDIRRLDACELQAEFRGFVGHAVFGVLVAHEAFFFSGRDEFAVDVQRGGRVMGQRAG